MILYLAAIAMPYVAVGAGLFVFQNAWVAILAYHAGIILILWLAKFSQPAPFQWSAPRWKMLVFGAIGCIAGIALVLLWPLVSVSPILTESLTHWGLTRATWPFFIGYSALVNPWLEELYWRGWLGSAARHPVANDAFFAGFHLVILAPFVSPAWLIITFLILTVTAWIWRQITHRAESLLPSALCHLVADVSILLVIVSEIT